MSRGSCILAATLALAACGGGETTGPGDSTPIAQLVLGVPADTLLVRETFDGTVMARSATGMNLPDRPMTWSSSDPTILSVSPGGRVTALRGGAATLSVSSGGVSATRDLVVRTLRFAKVFSSWQVSCGLEASGDLWCWGTVPASGYGNGSDKAVPSLVPHRAAIGHRFESLALAYSFACGVEIGGAVVCWGENGEGQLGDGSRTPHSAPVAVAGAQPAIAVVTGYAHACSLSASGTVSCWGDNSWGQLGDGTMEDRLTPVTVQGLPAASALAAGSLHTCALTAGGPMCWGSDRSGELGHDTTYDRLVPTRAGSTAELSPTYSVVSASDWHNCALAGGTAYCWGAFYTGVADALYDVFAWSPTVQAAGNQFTKLAAGSTADCGVESGGAVWCWVFGRAPVRFPSAKPLTDVAASYDLACVLDVDGAASCWHPAETAPAAPFPVSGAPPFVQIAAGSYTDSRVCGRTAAGAVWCWSAFATPPATAELTSGASTYSSIWGGSNGPVCALSSVGDVSCLSTAIVGFVPKAAGYSITQLATAPAGGACGLTAAGTAYCWGGDNSHGQLGDGTRLSHSTPAPVVGGLTFTSISAGYAHYCGTTAAGSVYCWGQGYEGEMGDGTGPFSVTPRAVSGNPTFTALGAGGTLTCGLDGAGASVCWSPRWTVAAPAPLTQLAVGEGYACGLDASGSASCWSAGNSGAAVPVPAGAPPFATIWAGGATNCAITAAGATWCWGSNSYGNLGSPDAAGIYNSDHPMRVYGQE